MRDWHACSVDWRRRCCLSRNGWPRACTSFGPRRRQPCAENTNSEDLEHASIDDTLTRLQLACETTADKCKRGICSSPGVARRPRPRTLQYGIWDIAKASNTFTAVINKRGVGRPPTPFFLSTPPLAESYGAQLKNENRSSLASISCPLHPSARV